MEFGEEDNLDFFFHGVQKLRSKWNTLNEHCRQLEASLAEANVEKKQLEDDLRSSCEHTKKVKEEKEQLTDVIKELYQDLKNSSVHRWIDLLGQKISPRNKPIRNNVSSSSNDENNFRSDLLVSRRNIDENSSEVTPSACITSISDPSGDHNNYNSPNSKKNHSEKTEKENVDQIPDLDLNPPSNELSTENNSKSDSTSTNAFKTIFEHPRGQAGSFVVEISEPVEVEIRDVENSQQSEMSSDNGPSVSNLPEIANDEDDRTSSLDTPILSQNWPQNNNVLIYNECDFLTNENKSNDDGSSKNGNEKYPEDNHDFSIGKEVPFKPSSRRFVSICYESPAKRESNSSDGTIDSPISAKFSQEVSFGQRRETLNEYRSNSRVSSSDVVSKSSQQNLSCCNECVSQKSANPEEIPSTEEAQSSNAPVQSIFLNEPKGARIDEESATSNGDKLTNREATPEELMSQIFGSPDHNSDVICTTKEPNFYDLDISDFDEDTLSNTSVSFASDGKNLPRIISNFKRETETADQSEFFKSLKRSCPPSSTPIQEPKLERSASGQLSKLKKDSVWCTDNQILLKCLLCKDDQVYGSYLTLDTHIITTHPNPYPVYFRCLYQRGNCERHFRTTKKLFEHIKRRHIGEDLSITIDKLFPGQRPWQCSVGPCRKIFAFNQHLTLHYRQMHGEKQICFGENRTSLKKIKHKRSKKFVKNRNFIAKCAICLNDTNSSEYFKTCQELDEHISNNHPNPYPFYFRCVFCETNTARHFKGLSWLNNHIGTCHSSQLLPNTN